MFLLRKLRFRTLGILILVLTAVAIVTLMLTASNHGDDSKGVADEQLTESVDATHQVLPLSDVSNSLTLSEVFLYIHSPVRHNIVIQVAQLSQRDRATG